MSERVSEEHIEAALREGVPHEGRVEMSAQVPPDPWDEMYGEDRELRVLNAKAHGSSGRCEGWAD